jgi:hypothetical protein
VDATARLADITITASSGSRVSPSIFVRPQHNAISADGFLRNSSVTVSVDGDVLADPVLTDGGGALELAANPAELEFSMGSTIRLDDGNSVFTYTVKTMTFDTFDPVAGTASGTADVPDGTDMYFEVWSSRAGSQEASPYQARDMFVEDGQWQVTFEPIADGFEVLSANAGVQTVGDVTVIDFVPV